MKPMHDKFTSWVYQHLPDVLAGSFVFISTFLVRNWYAGQRLLMPPGDVFNFLQTAKLLAHWTYLDGEKRLPAYSFFINIFKIFIDDPLNAAVAVSVISGAGALLVLFIVGCRLKIPREILLVLLTLASFQPLLVIIGIRPLSQSIFFLFLALAAWAVIELKPTRKSIILSALALILLGLTRVEGVLIGAGLVAYTKIKLPWKKWLLLVLAIVILSIPWFVVVTRSTGAPWKIPGGDKYFSETSSGTRGTSDPYKVLRGIAEIVESSWGQAWVVPAVYLEHPEDIENSLLVDLFTNPNWLIGLAAIVGSLWIAVKRPKDFFPLLFGFGLLLVIAAWYRPSGKYAAPTIGVVFLAASAGFGFLVFAITRIAGRKGKKLNYPAVLAVTIMLLVLSSNLMPLWAESAYGRATSGAGKGYSLVQAIRYLHQEEGKVALDAKVLMAEPYLGIIGSSKHPPQRQISLGIKHANATPEELVGVLQKNEIRFLVQRDTPRISELVTILEEDGVIVNTRRFYSQHVKTLEDDFTLVHELVW